MAAENYHLKWDSHLQYLNSSVATLYKNEKFADVVLYSSSNGCSNGGASDGGGGIPTVGISAHKFILSSCSQFFATMFETSPIASPNGVLYIVLPPDLSHRAIQILVQYMYSGEATVANDILNEVLRGGEILRIRGLCRTSQSSLSSSQHSHQHLSHQARDVAAVSTSNTHYATTVAAGSSRTTVPSEIYTPTSKCLIGSSSNNNASCTARYSIEHIQQTQAQQFCGLGASVLPKDSPVIVKSPKISAISLVSTAAPNSSTKNTHHSGGISVNKDVAIDPDEKCCYQSHTHREPTPTLSLNNTATLCNEVGCSSCSMSVVDAAEHIRRRQRSHSVEQTSAVNMTSLEQNCSRRDYSERNAVQDAHDEHEDLELTYERELRRESRNGRVREFYLPEQYEHHASVSNSKQYMETLDPLNLTPPPPLQHKHNFAVVKQEPIDWSAATSSTNENNGDILNQQHSSAGSPSPTPKQPLDFKIPLVGVTAVKLESCSSHSADEDDLPSSGSHFVCDVCKKTFDDPKTWLHHLDTHVAPHLYGKQSATVVSASSNNSNSNTASNGDYVPKKRRRVSQQDNNVDHVTLLCDLCSTSFETPAEWVRHMNNQHTEFELAMFNSKKDREQKTTSKATSRNHHHHQSHKSYASRSSLNYNSSLAANITKTSVPSMATDHHLGRTCDICNKKFSSHTNMLAHKRNHTINGNANSNPSSSASSSVSLSPIPTASAGGTANPQIDQLNSTTSRE